MICPKCGNDVGDNVKFCRHCGSALPVKMKKKFCRQCGNELSDTAKFCKQCGTPCQVKTETHPEKHNIEERFPSDDIGKTVQIGDQPEPWYKPESNYMEKDGIPDEDNFCRTGYDFIEEDERLDDQKGEKRKKHGWLIALIVVLVLLAAGTGVAAMMLCSPGDNIVKQVLNFDQDKAAADDKEEEPEDVERLDEEISTAESDSEPETEKYETEEETSTEESSAKETEELPSSSALITMDYVDSDIKNFPLSPDEFTEVASPDGVYTLKYPMNFFKTGYYNTESESYQFVTADGQISLEIKQEEADIKNDPQSCANSRMEQYKPLFLETDDSPYTYSSKAVAESGFSRAIIAGVLKDDETSGKYICTACNSNTTYTLTISYYALDTSGAGVSYTPTGYLLDCIYRGWSISGSTYQLRTYEEYMADDMGSKK